MKTIFDIETILFQLLNGKTNANGGVYKTDDRPDDSVAEDICINTITMESDALPITATSNVNVYVSDTPKKIGGKDMFKPNKKRLEQLTNEVLAILRNAHIEGCTITTANVSILADATSSQHYANIRVQWNIHN